MGQEALVIGLGVSGIASAKLLLAKGFAVTAVDRRFDTLKNDPQVSDLICQGMKILSDEELPSRPFSIAVLSPGIESSHPIVQQAKKAGIEWIGEIELAFRYLPNECVLGVTGSNGKTTTVLLMAHIFNASGKKAIAVGNVGAALSGYALSPKKEEILVVELSSFQLETLSLDRRFDAAAILNITPNHLNRHASMEEYANAKLRIGQCLKPDGRLFVSRQVEKDYGVKNAIVFDDEIPWNKNSEYSSVKNGCPEWQNIAAAQAICSFCKIPEIAIEEAIKTFRKPPHRIEWVAEIDGVAYYNDSKASNVEAVMHAVALFPRSVILIAGGVDKGASYAPWVHSFEGKVTKVIVFGQAAEKMKRELGAFFALERFSTLKEALQAARAAAKPGDTVLLSPGCSSYDQFANFEERGKMFKKMIREDCRRG